MCGIAGRVHADAARPVTEAELRAMCARMEKRGPDDEHVYVGKGAGLGARRLSIQDVPGGRQPLSNEDGTVWATFNGEIYNFKELREELSAKGHRFASKTDTEVLVHLYEEAGERMVERLDGMFAFGLWDAKRRRLLLARDRMGKKPLFYWQEPGGIAFASGIWPLMALPDLPRAVDSTAVDDFFGLKYIPSPRTIFKSVRKLPAAHLLIWESGRSRIVRYWKPRFLPKTKLTMAEAEAECVRLLRAAVARRLTADVPIGAFLSGGLDSSAVVALMAERGKVSTFTVGFEDEAVSETAYARLVADRFGTEHHEETVRLDALEVLPELSRHFGEPFADSSAVPTFYLARAARRRITVALNGDGGDEAFAGYGWYRLLRRFRHADLLPSSLKGALERLTRTWAAHPFEPLRKAARLCAYVSWTPSRRYADAVSYVHTHLRPSLYRPEFLETLGGHDPQTSLAMLFDSGEGDLLDKNLWADWSSFLPDQLCVKMDVATMANSLEARSPFLDRELVEFCASLPSEWKLGNQGGKLLLRKAFEKILPREIVTRAKQGFVVPLTHWMRDPGVRARLEEIVATRDSPCMEYLRRDAMENALREHASGKRNWAGLLWSVLVFDAWGREVLKR
ncbi:MAG: asparagine synthase (glutamine-hydrolyzing) [Elusimicrobia bacterium]|nr:asparagine synthase (glutamine-hydrolyzing) [Elusimicrobiota bacterium]